MNNKKIKENQSIENTTQLNENFNAYEWYTRGQQNYTSKNEDLQYNHDVYEVPADITVENKEKNMEKISRIWKNKVRRHRSSNNSTSSNSSTLKSTVSEFKSRSIEKLSTKNDLFDFRSLKGRLSSASTLSLTADEESSEIEKYTKLNSVAEKSEVNSVNIAQSCTTKKELEKQKETSSTVEEKSIIKKSSDAVLSKFTNHHKRFNAPRMTDDELIVIESMLRVQQAMAKYVLVAQLTSAVGQGILTSGISAAWSVPSIMLSTHHRIACKKHYAQCQDEISSRGLELAPLEEKSFAKRAFAIALGSGFVCCVLPIAMDVILDGAVVELVSNFFSDKVLLGLGSIIQSKGTSLTGGQLVKGPHSQTEKSNDTLIAKLKAYSKSSELFHRKKHAKQITNGEDEDQHIVWQREATSLFSSPVENEDEKSLDDCNSDESSSDEDDYNRKSVSTTTKKSLLESFDSKSKLLRWKKKIKTHFSLKNLQGAEGNNDAIPKYYIVSEEERMAWQREAESLFGNNIIDDISPLDYSDKQNSTSRRLKEDDDDSETDEFTLFGMYPDKTKAMQSNNKTVKQVPSRNSVDNFPLYAEADEYSLFGVIPGKMEATQSNNIIKELETSQKSMKTDPQYSETDEFSLFGVYPIKTKDIQSNNMIEVQKPSRKTVETAPLFSQEDEDELNRVVFTSLRGTHIHCNNYEIEQKINEVIRTTMLQAAHDARIRDATTLFSVDDARDIVDIVTLTLENCTDPELIDRNATYYF